MRLVIGGANQGKLSCILQQTGCSKTDIAVTEEQTLVCPVLNHLQLWIREWMKHGENPQKKIEIILQKNSSVIILCDEINCGIVPMEAFEREWREQTGRICCMLAKRATRVERVFCGIAVALKTEEEV